MTISNYKVVLSDKLYSIYKKVSVQHRLTLKERRAYEALISNIELDILTNAAQLERCKSSQGLPDKIFDDLFPALISSADKDLSLEDLAHKTNYKLILTQTEDEVSAPYFNIKRHDVKRVYTITRLHGKERLFLQDYLKSILKNAKKILIYDPYFSEQDKNKQLFSLLPDKDLTVQYVENSNKKNGLFIREACSNNYKWKVEQCDTTKEAFNRYARSHDRYLIIDDKLEVTLTSGFIYIWHEEKEITCIFKELQ